MAGRRTRRIALALAALVALAVPADGRAGLPDARAELRCDDLDPAHCLLPWPNDEFTVADSSTPTGRRVHLPLAGMPRNIAGKPIDPADYNRADGFSPGQLIVTKVPGLDTPEAFRRTGAVPITDVARSLDADAPVLVLDATTGRRHLVWSELDANPRRPEDVALLIRPAVNFEHGHRYVVALRDLKDADGRTLEAGAAFRRFRDRPLAAADGAGRPARMERMFRTLEAAGVAREDLYLAWEFTVASAESVTGRMLHMRDDAFRRLGDTDLADLTVEGRAPRYAVTKVTDLAPQDDARIARRVEGIVFVPCYLSLPGCLPGGSFVLGSDGLPVRLPGNVAPANFICNIPRWVTAAGGVRRARPALYGHGLFGAADGVNGGAKTALADEHGFVMCATDWSGMSESDLPNAVTILADLSRFPTLVDRVQQGMLNFLHLGRAMIHPDGFPADPAFAIGGAPVIDPARLFYDGGSQGGIIGGALTAVAPDFDRATLGVPGMNYSTLLRRSVDFDAYAEILYRAYPDELERPLILSLVQMLWDRGEANGYAHHMTDDPLPGTPPHEVLLNIAFGDHQVANVTAEVEARTIGANLRAPALDPGRHTDVDPYFGIPRIGAFPFEGSALTVWDIGPLRTEDGEVKGTTAPPTENVPNRAGVDPHGPDSSEEVSGRRLISEFLRVGGRVIDPCPPLTPCYLDGWTGP